MTTELKESRRLTGANLHWDHPSAIIDVAIDGPPGPVIKAWERSVSSLLEAIGWKQSETCFRVFEGGASLLISAPIDALYSMCELNELAWELAREMALGEAGMKPQHDLAKEVQRLQSEFASESQPALLALQAAAREHAVPFLWDDDEVSVGYGKTALVWARDALPGPADVDWQLVGTVPVALVTGTNGKSTTVRMTASIINAAGYRAGLTSTDFIRVGERTIERGDYSGTGGARMLMRQPDLEMAVLEVARGGLLRRGLGVERAQAVVVTNVAADHLGEYGINTVEELIPAKFIVRRALQGDDPLILNADDPGVVDFAASLDKQLVWFSLDPDNPVLRDHLQNGGSACYLKDASLLAASGGADGLEERKVITVNEIPATRNGMVRYNISNALTAMALAIALGIGDQAIREGLAAFKGDEHDNPGRGNWFEHKGVRIVVDFAHNEHGVTALADSVDQVGADRVVLLMGQAGDRLDKDIRAYTRAACTMRPDQLLVCALPGYERGRELMEVPGIIRETALELGLAPGSIEYYPGPKEATALALENARPGDLLVLLALTQRSETLALIHEFLGENG